MTEDDLLNQAPISQHAPYADLPKRQRARLMPLFKEYARVKEIYDNLTGLCEGQEAENSDITQTEYQRIIRCIAIHENQIAAQPPPSAAGWNRLSNAYIQKWAESFNLSVLQYAYRNENYTTARTYFEKERAAIFQNETFRNAISQLKKDNLVEQLLQLEQAGLGADFLGRMDGLWQVMQTLQVAFGLYSFERRGIQPHQKQNNPHPPPSLASFQYRQNTRDKILSDERLIDPAVGNFLYLDIMNDDHELDTWRRKTRPFYMNDQEGLLMPGLRKIDKLSKDIADRFETPVQARHRYTREAHAYWISAEAGNREDQARLTEIRYNYDLIAYLNPTLCLVHSLRGYRYAGGDLQTLLTLYMPPDVYHQSEIHYPWSDIMDEWERLDNEKAAQEKQRPKPSSITEERRRLGQQRYLEAVDAFAKAKKEKLKEKLTELTDDELDKFIEDLKAEKQQRADAEAAAKEAFRLAALPPPSPSIEEIRAITFVKAELRYHETIAGNAAQREFLRKKHEQEKDLREKRKLLRKQRGLVQQEITQPSTLSKIKKPKIKSEAERTVNAERMQTLRQIRQSRIKTSPAKPKPLKNASKADEPTV